MKVLKKLSMIINENYYQIVFTTIISFFILTIFPSLIVNVKITFIIKSCLLGFAIGLFFSKINNYHNMDGHILLNCYLGYSLAFSLIKTINNVWVNLVSFIIIIISTFYVFDTIIKNKEIIKNQKTFIFELLSIVIASISLGFQIIDFLK